MNSKKIIIIVGVAILIAVISFWLFVSPSEKQSAQNPTSFEECKEANGGVVRETWPLQCEFNGVVFVDESGNESEEPKAYTETEVLVSLKMKWKPTQQLFTFRPKYHNQAEDAQNVWREPSAVQFIGKNNVLIRFEDDNNVHLAVLNYKDGAFSLLETFENQGDFARADWDNLVTKHGNSTVPVSTYVTEVVRNGEIVSYERLTEVPENVFVKNYWAE